MEESYFVYQSVMKGNSCDRETRVGVSTGENHKVRHRFLVRAGVVWTDPSYAEITRVRTFLLEHRADMRRSTRHGSQRIVWALTAVFPRKRARRQYPLGVARATC
jgi:hypothetical protein